MLTAHGLTYDIEADQDTGKARLVIGGPEIDTLTAHDLFALLEHVCQTGMIEEATSKVIGSSRVRTPRLESSTSVPSPRPAPRAVR